jgi:hypothetical protein
MKSMMAAIAASFLTIIALSPPAPLAAAPLVAGHPSRALSIEEPGQSVVLAQYVPGTSLSETSPEDSASEAATESGGDTDSGYQSAADDSQNADAVNGSDADEGAQADDGDQDGVNSADGESASGDGTDESDDDGAGYSDSNP